MKTTATLITAIALALTFAAAADAKQCRDDHGKFMKCAMVMHSYKLDKKGKCHDEKGKFAKPSFCPAH